MSIGKGKEQIKADTKEERVYFVCSTGKGKRHENENGLYSRFN